MSKQPPIRPEQGSYGQFQLPSQPKTPFSRSRGALAKLRESIPQDEGQWQHARHLHRYNTAENIGDTSELTIQRYMSAVRAMVQAMDRVYLRGQRHRVFEGALLYSRISPSFLTHYTKVTGDFDSCFPTFRCIHPEIQASLPLAPAFILKYRHPQYRFKDICAALGTEVLGEDDYARFVSVLENGRPVLAVLSLPASAPFTALSVIKYQPEAARDVQKVAANTVDDIHMFALPTSFPLVYKVFDVTDAFRQLLQEVSHRITYESPREVPNTPLLELRWIEDYDTLVDQVIGDLVG
ncbi:hypothetical protein FCIRC_11653 [Fusarium circinatum]|uniref:Uncharacterized protein n=1 Tax=Fusarium circinatum TaxID=48490 RepID=A0A8H5WKI6_FUSCI|nr:hypothetical protein FCIRC_11653 [Fusarium circinatum]